MSTNNLISELISPAVAQSEDSHVQLNGKSFSKGSAGTADPLDQRSSIGWKGMKTAKILIDNYIVRVESKVADFADTAEN